MEVAAVPTVHKLLTRLLPVAVVGAGLLVASPAADAAHKAKKDPIATIALGDKRPATLKKARAHAARAKAKTKAKAQTSAVQCANTDVAPTADNLSVVAAAILC